MRRTIAVLAIIAAGLWTRAADDRTAPVAPLNSEIDAISIPRMINYQGKLTDAGGIPITGTRDMTFAIYADSLGSAAFWSEAQPGVIVNNGLFNVILGSASPISVIPEGPNCFLEVAVAGTVIAPRIRLVSAPFAFNARKAADIDDAAVTMPKINQSGAALGQVIKWNGLAWAPAADLSGGTGSVTSINQTTGVVCTPNPITTVGTVGFDQAYGDGRYVNEGQSAGGDLAGTYPSPTIAQKGATSGQVLKWTGSAWQPANDNDSEAESTWVRGTPDSILYTVHNLGIARGQAGGLMIGSGRFTHVNLGVACTTGTSGQNYDNCAVAGGQRNVAGGQRALVGGGEANRATATYGAIAGGFANRTGAVAGAVAGGTGNLAGNVAADTGAAVGGGANDTAWARYAFVGGGRSNLAGNSYAFVGGGQRNSARADWAAIVGGRSNTVAASCGGILSGYQNTAGGAGSDSGSIVCGGLRNRAASTGSFVGGGEFDTASSEFATVAGGRYNKAEGPSSFVGGGLNNKATGLVATVCGGDNNVASGIRTTICAGERNTASGEFAYIGGGSYNAASGRCAAIGGGELNYASNTVSGACVPGGRADSARADYSFATGLRSVVPSTYSNSAAFNGTVATASTQLRCGTLAKTGGSFTIDHPTDPANRILNHYFVESPDMSNIYSGSVVLDEQGRAEVRLPDYFAALNRSPRVQLTGVGTREVVYVAEDVVGNRFTVGGPARAKVYWQVTADRQDQSAEVIRALMPVEQRKTGELQDRMLDDDFLVGTMRQLEQMGLSDRFRFRTAAAQLRYDNLKRMTENPGAGSNR